LINLSAGPNWPQSTSTQQLWIEQLSIMLMRRLIVVCNYTQVVKVGKSKSQLCFFTTNTWMNVDFQLNGIYLTLIDFSHDLEAKAPTLCSLWSDVRISDRSNDKKSSIIHYGLWGIQPSPIMDGYQLSAIFSTQNDKNIARFDLWYMWNLIYIDDIIIDQRRTSFMILIRF
jgi:hypothetical protein